MKNAWIHKPPSEWTESEQLEFCKHLMQPVIEMMALRVLAIFKGLADKQNEREEKQKKWEDFNDAIQASHRGSDENRNRSNSNVLEYRIRNADRLL